MSTIFSKIISGELPAYTVAETDQHIAFLDIFPLEEGHTLVIPKKEVDNIFDLSSEEYSALFAFSQNIGKAIQKSIPCLKVGIAVVGLEVPHAHIHLIPLKHISDLDFTRPKRQFTKETFEKIRDLIQSNL